MHKNNKSWATDLAAHIKREAEKGGPALPPVDVAEILKIKPAIVVQPVNETVTYEEDDLMWGIDKKPLKVGQMLLLARDPSQQPTIVAVLDGNDPDPTVHPVGKALKAQVDEVATQARFFQAPVINQPTLDLISSDPEGTVRVNITDQVLESFLGGAWMPIGGGGGGGASALSGLSDVSLTSLASGDLLRYNGSAWANWTPNYLTTATAASTYLPLTGGTLTGALAMGTHKITGLAAASANGDALRYEQLFTTGTLALLGSLSAPHTQSISVGVAAGQYSTQVSASKIDMYSNFSNSVETRLAPQALNFGGGAGAYDWTMSRTAANEVTLAAGDVLRMDTVAVTDNSTKLATTAAVTTALSSYLTTATATSTYLPLVGGTLSGSLSQTVAPLMGMSGGLTTNTTLVNGSFPTQRATTSGITITLPTSPSSGINFNIINASAGSITIASGAGTTIKGGASLTLASGESCAITYSSSATNWYLLNNSPSLSAGTYLPLAGGTMSGAIAMGTHKITGLSAGTTSGDALRYEQVNGLVTTVGDLLVGNGAGNLLRVPAGADGTVFTADSSSSGGVFWGLLTNSNIAPGAAIALSKLAVDPLARANHTGTQLAATISNFDTQVRTSRLDQMAAPTASVAMGTQKLTGLAAGTGAGDSLRYEQVVGVYALLNSPTFTGTPTLPTGTIGVTQAAGNNSTALATTAYVDSAVTVSAAGLDLKSSVRLATTANITLSGTQTIDGVAAIAGDRVLVKNQTTGANNGVYVVAAGARSRSTDADTNAKVNAGMFMFVEEGTTQADTSWVLTTNNAITLGTTSLAFTQFGAGTAYTGTTNRITVSSGVIDIAATYTGQTSITTLGTVTTGSWNASPVPMAYGGTSATTAAGARTNLGAVNIAGDTMTGALAMGANKVTGLAAATAAGDALRYEQLFNTGVVALLGSISTSGTAGVNFAKGSSAAAPGWAVSLTTDAQSRVRVGLTASDVGAFELGPGTASRDWILSRSGADTAQLGSGDTIDTTLGTLTAATVAITDNSTKVATTAAVTTALGSYLTTATAASTYQPLDSDLTTIAGLTATTDSFLQAKAGAWSARTVAQVVSDLATGGLLTSATAASTYLTTTTAASTYVPLSGAATLSGGSKLFNAATTTSAALRVGVVGEANQRLVVNGAGDVLWTDPTAGTSIGKFKASGTTVFFDSLGVSTLDLASSNTGGVLVPTPTVGDNSTKAASTAFVSTALGSYAPLASPIFTGVPTAPTAAAGTNNTQIATTAYVDAATAVAAAGLDPKASVRLATTANITLSGTQTVDGVAAISGDRILVKNQTTASTNGIYVVASGAWTRAADADTSAKVTANMYMFVEDGFTQADTGWVLTTNNPITLGTTGLAFTQFNAGQVYTAGSGLTLSSGVFAADASILPYLNTTNIFTGWQLAVGAPGSSQSWRVSLNPDPYPRLSSGLNSSDQGEVAWGPGATASDVLLTRTGTATIGLTGTLDATSGTLRAATIPISDNSTKVATTAAVTTALASVSGAGSIVARVAALTNISTTSAPATIDGVTMVSGDIVLLTAQTTTTEIDLWTYNGSGSAMTHYGTATAGMTVSVSEGTSGDTLWILTTNGAIIRGTTVQAYSKLSVLDAQVVHLAGAETITGTKSMSGDLNMSGTATIWLNSNNILRVSGKMDLSEDVWTTSTSPSSLRPRAAFSGSTAAQTITLPSANTSQTTVFENRASVAVTVARSSTNTITLNGVTGLTSVVVQPGESLMIYAVGSGVWAFNWIGGKSPSEQENLLTGFAFFMGMF